MSSIIEGYNYDIFISYRQKDNKHDGWVTEFVENLKGELESTFKEEVSVYFDINPHDGLLETHDVNASLKEKLKCLIFIPIISRTYCDPKSFAWEHEFKAFVEMATKDQFGLKVKLPNGNVANRVLPVRIHELDKEDTKSFEAILGSVLRGIEFIYKQPGVNKPLSLYDNEEENQNRTRYRIQINKVANAIKEVISALHHGSAPIALTEESHNIPHQSHLPVKKFLPAAFIIIILLVSAYFITSKNSKTYDEIEKSIAVLPFINDSPKAVEENVPFINGLVEEITINLQSIKDFRVLGRTSVERFRERSDKSITEIARELGVNYIVEGSGQKYDNTLRLRVQLINAKGKESHLWAKSYEREINETKDIFKLQSQIASAVADELRATISPDEKKKIGKTPVASLEAYDAYLKGVYFYEQGAMSQNDNAIKWFSEAIRLDSTFALPWTYLSMCYWRRTSNSNEPDFKKAKDLAKRAVELDPNSAISVVNMAEILDNEYKFKEAEDLIERALSLEPGNQYILRNACRFFTKIGRFDEARSFSEQALKTEPDNPTVLEYSALLNYFSGNYEAAWSAYNQRRELEGHDKTIAYLPYQLMLAAGNYERIFTEPAIPEHQLMKDAGIAAANFALGKTANAEEICRSLIDRNTEAYWIAFIYSFSDENKKVFEWLEESYDRREKELTHVGVERAFKKYGNEPQFRSLLERMDY